MSRGPVSPEQGTATTGGPDGASAMGGDPATKITRVTSVQLSVLQAANDVDVVHIGISDGSGRGCQLLGGP